jgi:hypothetical protein
VKNKRTIEFFSNNEYFLFLFSQAKEYIRLNQDIKTMREMLTHYEHTIDQKDQTEKNLNKALDLLYNKTIAYRRYYEWRIIHIERQRQQYSLTLAKRFYEDKMKRVSSILGSNDRSIIFFYYRNH